jgi:hypothetical protein
MDKQVSAVYDGQKSEGPKPTGWALHCSQLLLQLPHALLAAGQVVLQAVHEVHTSNVVGQLGRLGSHSPGLSDARHLHAGAAQHQVAPPP